MLFVYQKGVIYVSNRDRILQLIDGVPDTKLSFVVKVIESLQAYAGEELNGNHSPNQDTIDAINEVANMQATGKGQHFKGATNDFLEMMMND